ASGNPETISFWVPAFALVHAHIFEVGRDGVAGTIPPPAESALTRVFDALWRWGGWRGAGRRRAGWGVVQLRTNAPHPPPPPPTADRSPPLASARGGRGAERPVVSLSRCVHALALSRGRTVDVGRVVSLSLPEANHDPCAHDSVRDMRRFCMRGHACCSTGAVL